MEQFISPITISIATLVGFIIGMVWYSPFLFMNAWIKGEGVTKDIIPKRSGLYMAQVHAYSFVAHGVIATVLAIIFELLQVSSMKIALSVSLLLTFGFIVSVRIIDMVYTIQGKHYEKRSQIKFLVSAGYYLTIVTGMSAVLFKVATW